MSIVVKNNILWVGQRDWEVRDFHGTEYKTLRGGASTTISSAKRKNVLIDTSIINSAASSYRTCAAKIDLADLDYIVINHAEEDHAGALTRR